MKCEDSKNEPSFPKRLRCIKAIFNLLYIYYTNFVTAYQQVEHQGLIKIQFIVVQRNVWKWDTRNKWEKQTYCLFSKVNAYFAVSLILWCLQS